jgi:hypothetical protein
MSTGNIKKVTFLGSKVRTVRGAANLTAVYEPIVYCLDNVGSLIYSLLKIKELN